MLFAKGRKLRVAVDTNILITALHFGGEAEVFLGMASSRLFYLFLSKYILWEMRMVLTKKFLWKKEVLGEAEKAILEIAYIVNPKRSIDIIKNDEADNRILECALAAQADVLVTNDKKHLLPINSFRGIQIVSLAEFLREFKP